MLNRSGESGHPCHVPEFRGNGFSFSPLSMMLAIGQKNNFSLVSKISVLGPGFYPCHCKIRKLINQTL
jgi:hypothetical protein